MLLQRLKEYADARLKLPPKLYSETTVRYIVRLNATGEHPQLIDTADPKTRDKKRGERAIVPQVTRSSSIVPLLLADNAEYTFGLAREKSKPERVAASHAAYLNLLERCAATTQEPSVAAVLHFLQNNPVAQLNLGPDFDRGEAIMFRVGSVFPHELPKVQDFWAAQHDRAAKTARVMQCVVCGQERAVLDVLQGNIKGVPGGQTSGTAIISANKVAFESYGLERSLIAPTCADCAERFTKALNTLLRDDTHRVNMGGSAFVFWTREPVEEDFLSPIFNPKPEQMHLLLESLYSSQRVLQIDPTAFYATMLSGSGARVVVRDWIDTTVGQVRRNIGAWFEAQQIVGRSGEEWLPLGITALAAAAVRKIDDLPNTIRPMLVHSTLSGSPLPLSLLYQAVNRNRMERDVTRSRATLIKLVLVNRGMLSKEDHMESVNEDHPSVAYHCGRLLAVIDAVQRKAIRNIETTVVDRFYGTASTAPASVFGRLINGSIPHLSKIKGDDRAAYNALHERLERITLKVGDDLPKTLTPQQQALFGLGYFHQRATDRTQARANTERRQSERDSASNDDL